MMSTQELFNVAVVATMSAGKSTLINALLGKELLHSANEATTAKITSIEQVDHKTFAAEVNKIIGEVNGQFQLQNFRFSDVKADMMNSWNSDSTIHSIELQGPYQNLIGLNKSVRIYDTPGPNNSQDQSHSMILKDFLMTTKVDLLIYVINATQIGINDDKELLKLLKNSVQGGDLKVLFVINKMDLLDADKGESATKIISDTRSYLKNIGFDQNTMVNILPISAEMILVASKYLNNEKLTKKERSTLIKSVNMHNDQYLTFNDISNFSLDEKHKHFIQLIRHSGLLKLNMELNQYINLLV